MKYKVKDNQGMLIDSLTADQVNVDVSGALIFFDEDEEQPTTVLAPGAWSRIDLVEDEA